MNIIHTAIPQVVIIEPDIFGDERGYFMETWNKKSFRKLGLELDFVQDNQSRSIKHTLRGLHYQTSSPQGKLVRVISGEIFDVAVDLRKSSSTFGQWTGEYLSSENRRMLWVPEGFAHGFLVTSDDAEVCYKCTNYYAPKSERSILWCDETIGIDWPLDNNSKPILSHKDKNGAVFVDAEYFA